MTDIKNVKDDSIIICPFNVKNNLIDYFSHNNHSFRIKYLSKEELKEGLTYSFNYDALVYLNDKYDISYSNCEEVLNNLLEQDIDEKFSNDKTKQLTNYYKELNENKLLHFNSLFKYLFENKNIYICGYSSLDNELISLLKKVGSEFEYLKLCNVEHKHSYIEFETIEDEVLYVFNDIMHRISVNKDDKDIINKIHLMSYSSDYDVLIKKYSEYFCLPIESSKPDYLYDSPIFKTFVALLKDKDIKTAYEEVKETYKNDPYDAIGRIANVVSQISFQKNDMDKFNKLLCYVASKTPLKKIKYDKCISIVDENDIIKDTDYVYVLGFSLDQYPRIYRDIDFYSDFEKEKIGLNTSLIKSKIAEEQISNFFARTNNVIITFKKKIGKKVFYPSLLIEKLLIVKGEAEPMLKRYNVKLAQMECANAKDNYRIYGATSDVLNLYSDEQISYMAYDNTFKNLTCYDGDGKLNVSYSSINAYYECPFRYFIKYVLHADKFEDRFTTELGNLFHKILEDYEKSNKDNIDLSTYVEYIKSHYHDEIAEHFVSAKDLVFLDNLLPQIVEVIKKNEKFYKNSDFKVKRFDEDTLSVELNIIAPLDTNTNLVGKIDKILFDDEEKNLAIIDYKTSGFYFEKEKVEYGIDLQLPIYAYLLSYKFPEYTNFGMYIQNICLDNEALISGDEIYLLDGLTIDDFDTIKRFDKSLGNIKDEEGNVIKSSIFVKGIKITSKNYLDERSKVTDKNDYDSLKDIASNKVKEAVNLIRDGKFPISPVKFRKNGAEKSSACQRCNYKGICFMKSKDIRHIDL